MSRYESRNGHHQIWIMNGVTHIPHEIRQWIQDHAGERWLGACGAGSMNGDRSGMMYNFSCRETAMLFKLTWG